MSNASSSSSDQPPLRRSNRIQQAKASSNPPANTHHDDQPPLPQPPPPPSQHFRLHALPDIIHDNIASFLSNKDISHIMEAGQWPLQVYGAKVKEVKLKTDVSMSTTWSIHTPDGKVTSLLRRRPGLVRLGIQGMGGLQGDSIMEEASQALLKGYCNRLQILDIAVPLTVNQYDSFINALAQGTACPALNHLALKLDLDSSNVMTRALADALGLRMEGGFRGLRSLQLDSPVACDFSADFLQSGACEELEVLKLLVEPFGPSLAEVEEAILMWIRRTRAQHLRVLKLSHVIGRESSTIMEALASPHVGPRLQFLDMSFTHQSLQLLCDTISRRSWPDVRELSLRPPRGDPGNVLRGLIDAIGVGVPELRTLRLNDSHVAFSQEVGMLMVHQICHGSWPRLEELDLANVGVGDTKVVALAKALEGGIAPCSGTLRRLNLKSCNMKAAGMKALARAMATGALPRLEYLNVGYNLLQDQGVVHLCKALEVGALSQLRELYLEMVNMGSTGMLALLQALMKPATCPGLRHLGLNFNRVEEDLMVEVVGDLETKSGKKGLVVEYDWDDEDDASDYGIYRSDIYSSDGY